ncbi:MAG: CPBP family intramembrane glutamate endopeptidase, partial [Actinomyces massiliensis]
MSEYHSDVKRSFVDLDPEFEQGHSNPAGELSVGGKILRVVCAVIVMAASDFFVILVSYILMTLIPGLRGMGNSADLGWEIKVLALLVNGVAVLAALLMCYVLMRTLDRGRGVSLHLRPSVSGGVWMVA